jgi:hypothetical protein
VYSPTIKVHQTHFCKRCFLILSSLYFAPVSSHLWRQLYMADMYPVWTTACDEWVWHSGQQFHSWRIFNAAILFSTKVAVGFWLCCNFGQSPEIRGVERENGVGNTCDRRKFSVDFTSQITEFVILCTEQVQRFEVLTAMMPVLVVTPCGPVGRYQRFGGTYCLHLQDWR